MCYTDKVPVQISLMVQLLVFFLPVQIYNLNINKWFSDLQLSPLGLKGMRTQGNVLPYSVQWED